MPTKARVKAIPDGYHTATPYLIVKGAAKAIDFYKAAFKAKERMRMEAPGGRVGHAEIQIGDSRIMLADESPEVGARGPKTIGGSPVMLHLYVKDVDTVLEQAVAAGAKVCQRRGDLAAAGRSKSAAGMRKQEGPLEGAFLLAARHS